MRIDPLHSPYELFFAVYVMIFVAELPDKTAFATVLMAARGHPMAVFVGGCAAFVVQSAVAVLAGEVFRLLPRAWWPWEHRLIALLFILFAILMWRIADEEEEAADESASVSAFWKTAAASFMVIFIAEWGDFTQLGTAAMMARYGHPWVVFCAATLALWSVTAICVLVGQNLRRLINPRKLQKVAAALFMAVGIYMMWTTWR